MAAAPVSVRAGRRFVVAPERVFDAWITPSLVARWMLAPAGGEILRLAVDARVSGAFCFVVRRQGVDTEHTGEYLELDRPRRLAFTWVVRRYAREASLVGIDLAPAGSGTELTLLHERVPAAYAESTEAGWNAILDAIAASLATGATRPPRASER